MMTRKEISEDYINCAFSWLPNNPVIAASYLSVLGVKDMEKLEPGQREKLRIKYMNQIRKMVEE